VADCFNGRRFADWGWARDGREAKNNFLAGAAAAYVTICVVK